MELHNIINIFSKHIDVQENDVRKMHGKTMIKTTGKQRTEG